MSNGYGFVTIPAKDVAVGMQLCIEYAPGREAEPMVKEITVNDDGTIDFHVAQFGNLAGYFADDMVAVLS